MSLTVIILVTESGFTKGSFYEGTDKTEWGGYFIKKKIIRSLDSWTWFEKSTSVFIVSTGAVGE